MVEDDFKDRIDVIDFIIKCLQEHEKKLDDLIYRLEQRLEKPANEGLTHDQAVNVITAFDYAIRQIKTNEVYARAAIKAFAQALNTLKLISKDWIDGLTEMRD